VKDHADNIAASGGHGHLEGLLHQLGADDPAAADVEDVGETQPALVGSDVSDVAAGPLAGPARSEVPLDQVWKWCGADVGDGGADLAPLSVR
jgi:hypothetical protein